MVTFEINEVVFSAETPLPVYVLGAAKRQDLPTLVSLTLLKGLLPHSDVNATFALSPVVAPLLFEYFIFMILELILPESIVAVE